MPDNEKEGQNAASEKKKRRRTPLFHPCNDLCSANINPKGGGTSLCSAPKGEDMKFSVGYRLTADGEWFRCLLTEKEHLKEIYFPWTGFSSGREETAPEGLSPFDAEAEKRRELKALHDAGIGMNLLLNGNCYGRDSLSRAFFLRLGDTLDEVTDTLGVSSVTTTSPVIAKFIGQNFGDLEVRASVNMEIGTPEGMTYLSEWFDAYY
ncbi:MAG TPA: hypothetical protein DDY70_05365, partial [Clostridiales bacterium]|nr:hypothetical protein [Clostridiales bacterium]